VIIGSEIPNPFFIEFWTKQIRCFCIVKVPFFPFFCRRRLSDRWQCPFRSEFQLSVANTGAARGSKTSICGEGMDIPRWKVSPFESGSGDRREVQRLAEIFWGDWRLAVIFR
jgi:hypothetical protein